MFRQLWKVKTFLSVGTFNDSIKDLSEELSKDLPDALLKETDQTFDEIAGKKGTSDQTNTLMGSNKKSAVRVKEEPDPAEADDISKTLRVNLLFQNIQVVVVNHDTLSSSPS